MTELFPPAVVG